MWQRRGSISSIQFQVFENKQYSLQDKFCLWEIGKNMQKSDKKISGPFRRLVLSNRLLTPFLVFLQGCLGKTLGP